MTTLPAHVLKKLIANHHRGVKRALNGSEAVCKLYDPHRRYAFYCFEAFPVPDSTRSDVLLYGFRMSPLGEDYDEWTHESLVDILDLGRIDLYVMNGLGVTRHVLDAGERP